jgi:hypothetical protein
MKPWINFLIGLVIASFIYMPLLIVFEMDKRSLGEERDLWKDAAEQNLRQATHARKQWWLCEMGK